MLHFFTHPKVVKHFFPQKPSAEKFSFQKVVSVCVCLFACCVFVCSPPWFVTDFPPIPLESKVSFRKPSAEKFSFRKDVLLFCFSLLGLLLCKHASGVHGSPTRVCYFFVFHLKSRLEETGGRSPDGGVRQHKLTVALTSERDTSMSVYFQLQSSSSSSSPNGAARSSIASKQLTFFNRRLTP